MATMEELVEQAMAKATYCERCDEEFTEDRVKVAPDEMTVHFTGVVDVICDQCVEAGVEAYLAHYEF